MNKHVELVEKWLSDNNSVSLEELKANRDDAYDDTYADHDVAYDAAYAAYDAAYAAYDAAYAAARAARAATYDGADVAAYAANCIKKYKELTK